MRTCLLAIFVLFATGCDKHTGTSPSSNVAPWTPSCAAGLVRVSGHVIDFGTGLGVSGATVVFDETAVSDASGAYTMNVAGAPYGPSVDGIAVGQALVRGCSYRGDLFVRSGLCVARYGTVTDARTQRPVVDATVSLGGRTAKTESDGWYRIDLGCPEDGRYGFNTTAITVSHPNYVDYLGFVGRGVSNVYRLDLEVQPR